MTKTKNELRLIIKAIIKEVIHNLPKDARRRLMESHQSGEWWIDDSGTTTYCDNQVVDEGHEAVVIHRLIYEILDYFGINSDMDGGSLPDYEESMKESLLADDRLSEEETATWDNMAGSKGGGPADIIIAKMLEDGEFNKDPKQAEDAVYIAYGSSSRDARDYAMRYWRWKVMKTFGGEIEVQTWFLKPEDLDIIVRGILDIMDDIDDEEEEKDPSINITIQASGKRFSGIPFSVLESKNASKLQQYKSGVDVGYTENLNEDFHHHHKDYRMYEGNNKIVAMFEDNSRLTFEVHYRNKHGEDREKHRRKAFSKWKTLANRLHGDVKLNEVGNPLTKSWKDCFLLALKDPEMKEFIRTTEHKKVFPNMGR